jgi:hypothetical protein
LIQNPLALGILENYAFERQQGNRKITGGTNHADIIIFKARAPLQPIAAALGPPVFFGGARPIYPSIH